MTEPAAVGAIRSISDREFDQYRRFIYEHAGIDMPPQKQHLVAGRLHTRLNHYGFNSYGEYFQFVSSPQGRDERQVLVDLLTTNETYFFREPAHFDFLRTQFLPGYRGGRFRAWSAACSSGEEVYTLAMVLAGTLGQGDWEIHGSDISQRMLSAARGALYPLERGRDIPPAMLQKYCLKGVRAQAGYFLVDEGLRRRSRFSSINLKTFQARQPEYDLIMLRNVLIYFDTPTKRDVVARLTRALRPGGLFVVSHVESLHGVAGELEMLRPSIFRRPVADR